MVFANIAQHALYHSLSPRIKLALEYLAGFDAATPVGRVNLDGDHVYALVQSYQTASAGARVFESHLVYADVQFVASGAEVIYTSPLDRLIVTTPYSADNDCALYAGPDDTPLHMRPGEFCILFPQDGHKPCCEWTQASPVKKVVVKVRL
ncbi:MAG: YhcH/YjgK/YiaL family protein [Opitutaceae bacterium]